MIFKLRNNFIIKIQIFEDCLLKNLFCFDRTNMVAVVSGGNRPMFAENTIMIYDDKKNKFVLEFTLPTPVLGVRLKRNKLVAICR